MMLDENKNGRSVERRATIGMKRRIKMHVERSKEFNEKFLSYLLISNIADSAKGTPILVWS